MQSCLRWRRGRALPGLVRLQHSHAPPFTSSSAPVSANKSKNSKKKAFECNSGWSIQARHALRAILRECSYLPDQHARAYLSHYAVSRFRVYSFKAWKRRDDVDLETRLKSKHEEARKGLNQLRRANQGERKPLLKALFMAYGRIGKRRRELLLPLLLQSAGQKPEKAASEEREDSIEGNSSRGLHQAELFDRGLGMTSTTTDQTALSSSSDPPRTHSQLPSALYALASSQTRAAVPQLTRVNPKRLRPEIPRFDAKMRPLTAARVKNLTDKWYADLIDRILPPLPTPEWYHLHQLALGKAIPEQPRPRRKPGSSVDAIPEKDNAALETVLARPRGVVKKHMLVNTEAHAITPRYLQRLYVQVFSQCPLLDWDEEKKRWIVTWGLLALHSPTHAAALSERGAVGAASDVAATSNVDHSRLPTAAPS